nr:MAG TPA: hypothetical protein [Caudoviricetes sp.]
MVVKPRLLLLQNGLSYGQHHHHLLLQKKSQNQSILIIFSIS